MHPVSNLTPTHTGHAFGPEGYKTPAYEIHADIGVPADVFVPVGYGEMLFGVWKGFDELRRLGVTDRVPRLHACEPAAGGPLSAALARDLPAARVTVGHTDAYGIDCPVGGYRGVVAVRGSGGRGLLVDDERMRAAQRELAAHGMWAELSAAAGLAAYRAHGTPPGRAPGEQAPPEERGGPVVCVSTSSGFKDNAVATRTPDPVDPSWDAVAARLRKEGISF
ncbi:hypothetical protein GCM10009863_26040 [Streptomyces axinellae]|uniref:Tryptophan synthase beta chain-like PALP domain-containing protein n=1 Tax=Streptomyces axinellae TaxID=552788 RepID=A0ABP6CGP8_9ACTN